MRAKLSSLNHCAVPFLNRADVKMCWYCCSTASGDNGNRKIMKKESGSCKGLGLSHCHIFSVSFVLWYFL